MTVKLGQSRSELLTVNAGAPQGSVLGTFVFNIATDDLEEDLENPVQSEDDFELQTGDLHFLDTNPDSLTARSTPIRNANLPAIPILPIGSSVGQDFVLLSTARNVPTELTSRIEPTWRSRPLSVRKFVDDNLQMEKMNMKKQKTYRSPTEIFKNPRVLKSEQMFKHIAKKAYDRGLRVNAAKTNLLVVSASKSYEARAHFFDEDNTRVDCSTNLKALGFTF